MYKYVIRNKDGWYYMGVILHMTPSLNCAVLYPDTMAAYATQKRLEVDFFEEDFCVVQVTIQDNSVKEVSHEKN